MPRRCSAKRRNRQRLLDKQPHGPITPEQRKRRAGRAFEPGQASLIIAATVAPEVMLDAMFMESS